MKVIDLLNKIANGEEVPKKIMYGNIIWKYDLTKRDYRSQYNAELFFYDELDNRWIINHLNTEVEIIEEDKKIEKIIPTSLKGIDNLDEKIEIAHIDTISAIDKINEIIDKINRMEEK